jgi:hypothetical protein
VQDIAVQDISSGSGDVTVATKPAKIHGHWFKAGATATTIIIRDDDGNNIASAKVLYKVTLAANGDTGPVVFPRPLRANKGIVVDRDGTNNAEGSVFFL